MHCSRRARRNTARTAAASALAAAYQRGESDEFVLPTVICDDQHKPATRQRQRRGRVYEFSLRPRKAANAGIRR